ncbi:MAG TPA: hypothetical protein VJX67_03825 [Blastocatellia bacterium]|nr:hypothetical protein [Blastocatellia bacterium]
MIENDDQLNQTRSALVNLESALASLKRDILPANTRRYSVMAEPIVHHIQELRAKVDQYVGVTTAIEGQVDLWVRLKGENVEFNDAPTSVVGSVLRIIRTGIQSAAEYAAKEASGTIDLRGLRSACDLRISAWEPGSVNVGLRIPEVEPGLEAAAAEARGALDDYLAVAGWAGQETPEETLTCEVPDPGLRRVLLNQVSRLAPRRGGALTEVELTSPRSKRMPAKLTQKTRQRIQTAIDRSLASEGPIESAMLLLQGLLREIDLDSQTLRIHEAQTGRNVKCAIAPSAADLLTIAKQALDHEVVVRGRALPGVGKQKGATMEILEIEETEPALSSFPDLVPPVED